MRNISIKGGHRFYFLGTVWPYLSRQTVPFKEKEEAGRCCAGGVGSLCGRLQPRGRVGKLLTRGLVGATLWTLAYLLLGKLLTHGLVGATLWILAYLLLGKLLTHGLVGATLWTLAYLLLGKLLTHGLVGATLWTLGATLWTLAYLLLGKLLTHGLVGATLWTLAYLLPGKLLSYGLVGATLWTLAYLLLGIITSPSKTTYLAASRGPPGSTEATASFPPHFFGVRAAPRPPPSPLVGVLYRYSFFFLFRSGRVGTFKRRMRR